jgi:hypothetical protein
MPELPPVVITDKDLSAIAEFSHYLDSLKTTPQGMIQYQELAKARPGLIDSLATVQRFFFK